MVELNVNTVKPDQIRALRESLPPLSVFGAALYTWMLAGHMSVGILWPRCRETMAAGLVTDPGKKGCELSAEDLVEEISHCRHVDREFQSPDVSGVTPMPTTIEVIATGAVLESEIRFAPHATEVEKGCVCFGLEQLRAMGGKAGAGFGRVDLDVIDGDNHASAYLEWLESCGGSEIRDRLVKLATSLGKTTKKGKK